MKNKSEQVLIVGKPSFKKRLLTACFIVGIIATLLGIVLATVLYGDFGGLFPVMLAIGIPCLIISIFLYLYGGKCSVTVTDKRIFGKAGFGTQVDLPLDMVSAVATSSLGNSIIASTASGKIKFMYIANCAEIYAVISELLMNRQEKTKDKVNIAKRDASVTDELKKFKELLDMGAITQEEFDAKKKELLGL